MTNYPMLASHDTRTTPHNPPPLPRILVFRNELLPSSETFIAAQTQALRSYEPIFAGTSAAPNSLSLPSSPVLVDACSDLLGKLRRRLFWRASFAPAFFVRLKAMQPSLVHAHFALDAAAALPISQHLQVPLIVTLHGYDVTSSDDALRRSPEGRLFLRRRKLLWKHASVFLCVSDFMRGKAIDRGFPADKLRLHYTGIDLNLFAGEPEQRDPNLIVFVGRLVEKKGCTHLLDALALLRKQLPSVRLTVIGTGPLEPELWRQTASANLPCDFLGAQPPHIVKEHLARARIFCVPSVTATNGDSEGLGMVFAEAQAMGTPVVSFQHGGIPEVVLDGQTGLLAPERDSPSLAASLLRLLTEDDTWSSFSQQGIRWVRKAFDLHRQTAELEQIYDAVRHDAVLHTAHHPLKSSPDSFSHKGQLPDGN